MAVPRRLGDRDDVRDGALLLERPEPRAQPAVADLHLVRDADAARLANVAEGMLEVPVRGEDAAPVAEHRLADEGRRPGRGIAHELGVAGAGVWLVRPDRPPV